MGRCQDLYIVLACGPQHHRPVIELQRMMDTVLGLIDNEIPVPGIDQSKRCPQHPHRAVSQAVQRNAVSVRGFHHHLAFRFSVCRRRSRPRDGCNTFDFYPTCELKRIQREPFVGSQRDFIPMLGKLLPIDYIGSQRHTPRIVRPMLLPKYISPNSTRRGFEESQKSIGIRGQELGNGSTGNSQDGTVESWRVPPKGFALFKGQIRCGHRLHYQRRLAANRSDRELVVRSRVPTKEQCLQDRALYRVTVNVV